MFAVVGSLERIAPEFEDIGKRREQYVRFWLTALGAAESGRLAA